MVEWPTGRSAIAVYTILAPAELEAIVAAFGHSLREAHPEPKGSVNTLYRIVTDRGAFYLRVNEGKRPAELAYELALVAHLVTRGVPTPPFQPTASGDAYLARDGRLFTLGCEAPGRDPCHREVTVEKVRAVGAALARLHLAGRDFPERRGSRYAFERIVERLAGATRQLEANGDVEGLAAAEILAGECDRLRAVRVAVHPTVLPTGVIHGDLFRDNVLFAGDRLTALLDLEQASDGAFVYDLAVTLCAWCFQAQTFDATLARALVAGYATIRPLEESEASALAIEARTAAVRFAVTRLTDFHLRAAVGVRLEKDYRRYLRRLLALRELGVEGVARLITA